MVWPLDVALLIPLAVRRFYVTGRVYFHLRYPTDTKGEQAAPPEHFSEQGGTRWLSTFIRKYW